MLTMKSRFHSWGGLKLQSSFGLSPGVVTRPRRGDPRRASNAGSDRPRLASCFAGTDTVGVFVA